MTNKRKGTKDTELYSRAGTGLPQRSLREGIRKKKLVTGAMSLALGIGIAVMTSTTVGVFADNENKETLDVEAEKVIAEEQKTKAEKDKKKDKKITVTRYQTGRLEVGELLDPNTEGTLAGKVVRVNGMLYDDRKTYGTGIYVIYIEGNDRQGQPLTVTEVVQVKSPPFLRNKEGHITFRERESGELQLEDYFEINRGEKYKVDITAKTPNINVKAEGTTLKVTGKETKDGNTEYFRVKITDEDGNESKELKITVDIYTTLPGIELKEVKIETPKGSEGLPEITTIKVSEELQKRETINRELESLEYKEKEGTKEYKELEKKLEELYDPNEPIEITEETKVTYELNYWDDDIERLQLVSKSNAGKLNDILEVKESSPEEKPDTHIIELKGEFFKETNGRPSELEVSISEINGQSIHATGSPKFIVKNKHEELFQELKELYEKDIGEDELDTETLLLLNNLLDKVTDGETRAGNIYIEMMFDKMREGKAKNLLREELRKNVVRIMREQGIIGMGYKDWLEMGHTEITEYNSENYVLLMYVYGLDFSKEYDLDKELTKGDDKESKKKLDKVIGELATFYTKYRGGEPISLEEYELYLDNLKYIKTDSELYDLMEGIKLNSTTTIVSRDKHDMYTVDMMKDLAKLLEHPLQKEPNEVIPENLEMYKLGLTRIDPYVEKLDKENEDGKESYEWTLEYKDFFIEVNNFNEKYQKKLGDKKSLTEDQQRKFLTELKEEEEIKERDDYTIQESVMLFDSLIKGKSVKELENIKAKDIERMVGKVYYKKENEKKYTNYLVPHIEGKKKLGKSYTLSDLVSYVTIMNNFETVKKYKEQYGGSDIYNTKLETDTISLMRGEFPKEFSDKLLKELLKDDLERYSQGNDRGTEFRKTKPVEDLGAGGLSETYKGGYNKVVTDFLKENKDHTLTVNEIEGVIASLTAGMTYKETKLATYREYDKKELEKVVTERGKDVPKEILTGIVELVDKLYKEGKETQDYIGEIKYIQTQEKMCVKGTEATRHENEEVED